MCTALPVLESETFPLVGAATKPKKAPKTAPKPKKAKAPKKATKGLAALDAAFLILSKSDDPMRPCDLITAMAELGLWTSPVGRTPAATLTTSLLREIMRKGPESRFAKAGPGKYTLAKK